MHRATLPIALFAALTMASVAASAQTAVPIGGYTLLNIRCDAPGYTAQQRAEIIGKRVAQLLSLENPTALDIRIEQVGDQANVYAGGNLFVTVLPCDARANGTTVMGLARVWAGRLQQLYPLALPRKPGVGLPGEQGAQSGTGPAHVPV